MTNVFQRRAASSDRHLSPTLEFLIKEPAEVYHAKRGQNLSSHLLGDFRRCPQLYHDKVTGQIADGDRPAYLMGRAAHTLTLEGRQVYNNEYAVGGPINPSTGKSYGATSKKFQDWAAAQNKDILSDAQAALVEELAAAVHKHEEASQLIATGVPEGVARAELCGVPCQIRIDWLNPENGIVDLKTCDDLDWFEADARRYGYAHQLAFYRSVLHAATDCTVPVYIIAVEKKAPYRVGVWHLTEQVLDSAERDNREAIHQLRTCRDRDNWPTGYEDIRAFDYIT